MTKEELLEHFQKDFLLTQGALSEILEHNRSIDTNFVDALSQGDTNQLEEHIELSKLILDGVKGFNELYRNAPIVLENINKMQDREGKAKDEPTLAEVMASLDNKEPEEETKAK